MDTSVLIDIQQRFPQSVFKGLWRELESAAEREIIIFVDATEEELMRHSVSLAEWIRPYYLHKPTESEQEIVAILQEDYPDLVDWNAYREFADPYILACSKYFDLTIVTQEKYSGSKAKIPTVASNLQLRCIRLNNFLVEMGWEF